jgi:menaquinone-dependent protoporphyrinogen oxidase
MNQTRVLVAFASRHGSTQGIAERIGRVLERHGLEVTVQPAAEVHDIGGYQAFVIGSAAYVFHWLKEASGFVRRHRSTLANQPVWLFSSGPVGSDTVDAKGNDVRTGAEPKEFAEFREAIHPRDEHIFWGAYDPDAEPIGLVEKLGKMLTPKAARGAIPAGDFRDWPEIEAWSEGIARELAQPAGAAVARS